MAQAFDPYSTIPPHCNACSRSVGREAFLTFAYRSPAEAPANAFRRMARRALCVAALIAGPAIYVTVELRLPEPPRSSSLPGPWNTEVCIPHR